MLRFSVTSVITNFLICYGDCKGLCDTCTARFYCYTGELPSKFARINFGVSQSITESVEYNIFKKLVYVIDYDYDKHDEYHLVKCHRSEPRTKFKPQTP